MYREAHIVPQFIDALCQIDWPKKKLDVLLLLEVDDQETHSAVKKMDLPPFVKILIVPESLPKTKPKACNYGLAHAKGEFIVIYDAEDIPDPMQLKKAYLAFNKLPKDIICLQAKLNYYNPHHNLLTRLFTAEYSLWFDMILPGLQSIETSIPLGGTSNHFKTENLKNLKGWDPFNVAEDCDLGIRLFQEGYKTAIIDSTTFEEANSQVGNWLRQRSRWLKGYLQTYFVHMKDPVRLLRKQGLHAFVFQLVVGGKIAFMLINPFLWLATISYFTLFHIVGPAIEAVYPSKVFYMAATSLVVGNFLQLYNYMIGTAKREHYSVIKYIFLVPFYWLLVSIGAGLASFQLIFKPHYWEKTVHGLHLSLTYKKDKAKRVTTVEKINESKQPYQPFGFLSSNMVSAAILVASSMAGNLFNFFYNAYLTRHVDITSFGTVSLIGSFLYISQVPLGALGKTIVYRSAFLFGKYNEPIKSFWSSIRIDAFRISLVVAGLWLVLSSFIARFFQTDTLLPFILFTPVWIVGTLAAIDSGFLTGNLRFKFVGFLLIVETTVKFFLTVLLVTLGYSEWVYAAIPGGMFVAFLLGWLKVARFTRQKQSIEQSVTNYFPKRFFVASSMTTLATISFLTFDVLLAKHFLTPLEAGHYAALSLVGKMIFFMGNLSTQFIVPLGGKKEGEGRSSHSIFSKLLLVTITSSVIGFISIGIFGFYTVPLLFGDKVNQIVFYLPRFALAMAYFTIAMIIVNYHQVKHHYIFPFVSFLLTILQITAITFFHTDISAITAVVLVSGILQLFTISSLHLYYEPLASVWNNLTDFLHLFNRIPSESKEKTALRILIFNWRDTKHVWAGGAEVYIQQLAKRWVSSGHKVTLFCGNDRKHSINENLDGVKIVRRGGFYTVYLWAIVYYLFRFRGQFDVVIDCQNGVPFFTPLYTSVPKFLLIHHVHQEVFRKHLRFPLAQIAMVIEGKVMPFLYKKQKVVTISESSRKEILHRQLSKENIQVINPGVDTSLFTKLPKTPDPSFTYLGRLKPYKNIDVAIKAFAQLLKDHPQALLNIAGEGESMGYLKRLADQLDLKKSVKFWGKVTERQKADLLTQSWAALQPSSFEGWGITVIEANAAGTPVIASNINGLRDSVINGKTGVLVPVGSPRALSSAMDSLIILKSFRLKLTREAYNWAQKFSWDKSAEKLLEILQNEFEEEPKFSYATRLVLNK
ncbi:glycosyltransferase [Candidatus Gottesmanbacteria bacterium]|nr:glycosyltransferase [Candidatus Gottesmanbacteria bacterium]